MSDVLEQMKTRRSVKKYKPDMVPQEIIDKVTEAGLYAANGMGRQATIIIQVTNKEMRDKLSELNRQIGGWKEGFDPFYGAPAVLVVLGKKDCPTHVYDGSLVMGNLMLAAHELGVGSCWIHRAKEEFETDFGAFNADYRPSYHAASAEDGWQRMLEWFKQYGGKKSL